MAKASRQTAFCTSVAEESPMRSSALLGFGLGRNSNYSATSPNRIRYFKGDLKHDKLETKNEQN
jgi:hypothetical protein